MGMWRNVTLGVAAAAVVVVAAAGYVTMTERGACGCSIVPDVRRPATEAATRFATTVRAGDVAGAWAQLSSRAQARYGDTVGFQPVFDRFRDTATGPVTWLPVADKVDYQAPSEAVVVGHTTGSPRLAWSLVVEVTLGRAGQERVDPEPDPLTVRATRDTGAGLRVELPVGGLRRTWFTIVDASGILWYPSESTIIAGTYRLTWSDTPVKGEVLAIVAARTDTGWRVGTAAVA